MKKSEVVIEFYDGRPSEEYSYPSYEGFWKWFWDRVGSYHRQGLKIKVTDYEVTKRVLWEECGGMKTSEIVDEFIRLSDVFDPWGFDEYISCVPDYREQFTESIESGSVEYLVDTLEEFLEMASEGDEEYGNVVQLINQLKEREAV